MARLGNKLMTQLTVSEQAGQSIPTDYTCPYGCCKEPCQRVKPQASGSNPPTRRFGRKVCDVLQPMGAFGVFAYFILSLIRQIVL